MKKTFYLNAKEDAETYSRKASKIMVLLTFGVKQGKSYKVTVEEVKPGTNE